MGFSAVNCIEYFLERFEICSSKFSVSSILIPSNLIFLLNFVYCYCLFGSPWLETCQDYGHFIFPKPFNC